MFDRVSTTFASVLVEKTRTLVVGHGAKEGTTMGLLTTPMGVQKAKIQVSDDFSHGENLALGTGKGALPEGAGDGKGTGGYFMATTILIGMTNGTPMSQEETVGSVRGLFKFETEAEVCSGQTIQA